MEADLITRAHTSLQWYRKRFAQTKIDDASEGAKPEPLINARHYNILIRGWAKLGQLNRVSEVLSMMKASDVKPNEGSYIWLLYCLSKRKGYTKDDVEKYLKMIESNGIALQSLFKVCIRKNDY